MRALFLFLFLFVSAFAQDDLPEEEVMPAGQDAYYSDLQQENEDLRSELEQQGSCNCNQQREEYVTEQEQVPPVIIINQAPPEPVVQKEEENPQVDRTQFSNDNFNDSQFKRPPPVAPAVDVKE